GAPQNVRPDDSGLMMPGSPSDSFLEPRGSHYCEAGHGAAMPLVALHTGGVGRGRQVRRPSSSAVPSSRNVSVVSLHRQSLGSDSFEPHWSKSTYCLSDNPFSCSTISARQT